MNTLHSYLIYYLLVINAATFIIYGIDKYKAKKAKWRISEATLLTMAAVGGSIGSSNTEFLLSCSSRLR